MPRRSIVEHVLPQSVEDQWLSLALSKAAPFPDESIAFLTDSISDRDFMFVGTISWQGQPASLIFRLQRTVTAAGQQLRQQILADRASISGRWLHRPIELEPFTDRPVVSRRGECACSHQEAMQIARDLLKFSSCSILYRSNQGLTGRA